MRWRILLVPFLALFVAVSCDQQPFEPLGVGTAEAPLFDAGKSPNSNMELLWVWEVAESEAYADSIPCFNNGEGENILAWGRFEFWAHVVDAPSGNHKEHGEFRGFENYKGLQSGDRWIGLGIRTPTLFFNTRHSDGYTIINEPVWNFAQNQTTGEIVRIMWRFHQVLDDQGNFVRADVKITDCKPWNGQIH